MSPAVDEYFEKYVAEDGGGRLDPAPGDSREPFAWGLRTTQNENPILFLVQMAMESVKKYPATKQRFKDAYLHHMAGTEIEPGLHSRRPGDAPYIGQSHDNMVGAVIGGWLFESSYAESIYRYGAAHQWCFNVTHPGQYDVKHQIQGGDIAICALATGRKPEKWYLLWLAGGLSVTKAFNLADLRIEFLERGGMKDLSFWEKLMLRAAIAIHRKRRGPPQEGTGSRFAYFRPEHPFVKIQREVV